MFPLYFGIQAICGLLATAPALGWVGSNPSEKVHRRRLVILLGALITVLAGWLLEMQVSELRVVRETSTDLYLQSDTANAAALEAMRAARADFGRWHFYSLLLNFGTLLLVTIAMAMTVTLPPQRQLESFEGSR